MDDVVILEWTYSPPDYFEETIHITRDEYQMTIESGKVEARIKQKYYDKEHKFREVLHDALNLRFISAQLLSHKRYELSKASMYFLHADGRKDITFFTDPIVIRMSLGTPDLIVKDKHGNIISDPRRDRIEKQEKIYKLVEKYIDKDPLIGFFLNSFSKALSRPDNELVYLYEIYDALKARFNGEDEARKTLSISNKKWSLLKILANKEPLEQGRHREQNVGSLRAAKESELIEARNMAQKLMEAYLEYLERQEQQ